MAREVYIKAGEVSNREHKLTNLKIIVLAIFIILFLAFVILRVIYNGGSFTVSLDRRMALDYNIVIYEDPVIKGEDRKLVADKLEFMDNISIKWIPESVDGDSFGSHNGENYIAYTFYIDNKGSDVVNYWYTIVIDDVIKRVDEACRVMIYLNGEKSVYAKINSFTNLPEKDTEAFFSDTEAVLKQRKDFRPGDVDKFTIVIWLEGDDPDCINEILGGEIKMHMEIREEYKEGEKDGSKEEKEELQSE